MIQHIYKLIRYGLFLLDEERAHALCLSILKYWPGKINIPLHPVTVMGMHFPHAIGLAAGFDKDGRYLSALAKLGFAFIEVGTVTPRPQSGNAKPRLFRIPQVQALINRMGFNNLGVDALVNTLQTTSYHGILGINIGKNKDTSLENASDDYLVCLEKIYNYASYITLNISSPNTQELRVLQQKAYFADLIVKVVNKRADLAAKYNHYVPLVIKISPDETIETLKNMVDVMLFHGIDGLIVTNTTSSHQAVADFLHGNETGGVSGGAVRELATQCLRQLQPYVGDNLTLIAAGGIDSPAAIQQKQAAGAQLFQVYTGLIYQGPTLIQELAQYI